MNFVTAVLLFAFFSIVVAFPIAGNKKSIVHDQHQLFSSSDDQIVDDARSIETTVEVRKNVVKEDTKALSGLLGEMFEAKLEMSREAKEAELLASKNTDMPVLGNDGIYRIINQRQLENFKAANSDKLVFVKFSSPICAACRMLKQKFQTLHRSPKLVGAPVVFADIIISNNKKVKDPFRDYITSELQVQRIPTIHFYANTSVNEIYCEDEGSGCSWPKIRQKMLDCVGQHYTPPPPPPATTHNVSSSETTAATAIIKLPTTAIATTHKISKRQRIRRLLSLSWLR